MPVYIKVTKKQNVWNMWIHRHNTYNWHWQTPGLITKEMSWFAVLYPTGLLHPALRRSDLPYLGSSTLTVLSRLFSQKLLGILKVLNGTYQQRIKIPNGDRMQSNSKSGPWVCSSHQLLISDLPLGHPGFCWFSHFWNHVIPCQFDQVWFQILNTNQFPSYFCCSSKLYLYNVYCPAVYTISFYIGYSI